MMAVISTTAPTSRERTFWTRVQKGAPDECWEWQGGRNPVSGYGQFLYGGTMRSTHRLSWMFTHGDIPSGMLVLHHCDNKPCVNPSHLHLGDQKRNMGDASKRGLLNCAIPDNVVLEIRRMRSEGESARKVAERFSIHTATVYKIERNKSRAYVGD